MANPIEHTPGPWKPSLSKASAGCILIDITAPNGIKVASCHSSVPPADSTIANALEARANARLISTAPTLLKIAKLALLEFGRISYIKKADPQIIDLINTAIDIAEGK